ncbi:MAG: NCS2 family permease [Elusimicrobiota bacterium]|jgi:AGZA family xanthine/uracil permease-like MFS transporter
MNELLERRFQLKAHGTDLRTEFLGGLATFVTMAYILFVNPLILSLAGLDRGAVFTATVLSSAIGTLVMGLYANVPFALAPGMGLNAFFTFTVVTAIGLPWQQALAVVFLCGIVNILITVTRVRKMLINAIPESLQYAISAGIGLFIAYIGFKNAHFLDFIVQGDSIIRSRIQDGNILQALSRDVIPQLVSFSDKTSLLSLAGLLMTAVLMLLRVHGAILIGILLTTAVAVLSGAAVVPEMNARSLFPPSLGPTLFALDIRGLLQDTSRWPVVLPVILGFSLTDTFDTVGTFLGTGRKTGIFDDKDEAALHHGKGFSSKLDRALFADSIATSMGALLGTSNVTTYVESAAGISVGARTGLASVFTALFFLLSLFIAPLVLMIPAAATAPALILIGVLMMDSAAKIRWEELDVALPAFFTAAVMPFAYSISNGIAAGFIFHVLVKLVRGKPREIHPLLYIAAALFLLNFILGARG